MQYKVKFNEPLLSNDEKLAAFLIMDGILAEKTAKNILKNPHIYTFQFKI